MSQALQKTDPTPAILEQVIIKGDLSKLTSEQRVSYYNALCQSLNINPLSKPFEFLELNGKLVLYARKDATEQLRQSRQISITGIETEQIGDLLIVTAHARTPDGRTDTDRGVVYTKGVFGDNLANAHMKAVTKAKRRVTLSICGLGFLDESEIESIKGARVVNGESDDLVVSHKASGLDQWKCKRPTAMELLKVCEQLRAKGISEEEMRKRLPKGVESRKDLTEEQAQEVLKRFRVWATGNPPVADVVEGEVVNG